MISTYKTLNYDLGETVDMIREQVNSFARDEIAPRAAQIDPVSYTHLTLPTNREV